MDRDERRRFVGEHRTCVLGYARQQHGPAMTVVYYVTDGDDILVSTMAARGKAKAVDRDPRVSLCVLDENWPLGYLQVYGTAVVERDEDQAADVLRRIVELMAGEPVPPERWPQIAELAKQEEAGRATGHPVRDLRDAPAACAQDGGPGQPQSLDQREPALVTVSSGTGAGGDQRWGGGAA